MYLFSINNLLIVIITLSSVVLWYYNAQCYPALFRIVSALLLCLFLSSSSTLWSCCFYLIRIHCSTSLTWFNIIIYRDYTSGIIIALFLFLRQSPTDFITLYGQFKRRTCLLVVLDQTPSCVMWVDTLLILAWILETRRDYIEDKN